ncbi:helix-turn-helix domain-containing protein [Micromonospora sp. NPDC048843]|uniref:helix-turn-helix domain-containing protein n=1 Tax=Micromonospora sp. NPDC048843 TaxID=3155389 RepID=UPI003410BE84
MPIGRRVAYWRVQRKLSQQSFADRLGKSKSWVDKAERGVRSLDRLSTLQEIAAVLRIDVSALLGRDIEPVEVAQRLQAVDHIRTALSTYEVALARPTASGSMLSSAQVADLVKHAWITYQQARYPQLITLLPNLLMSAQRAYVPDPEAGQALLVDAYRITAALLVKLDEAGLAWLAADRAMNAATGEAVLLGAAAVQLGQVLRVAGRARSARSVALSAAYRIAPPDLDNGRPEELSLCGALLVQAGLAAARQGEDSAAARLLDEAAELAVRVGEGRDDHQTNFGPTAVDLARVAAALDLDAASDAVVWHERATSQAAWSLLPAEYRAGHLINAARAYLQTDDPVNAGRALIDAERTASAEIHHRPVARKLVAQVARCPAAPATVIGLAAALNVT